MSTTTRSGLTRASNSRLQKESEELTAETHSIEESLIKKEKETDRLESTSHKENKAIPPADSKLQKTLSSSSSSSSLSDVTTHESQLRFRRSAAPTPQSPQSKQNIPVPLNQVTVEMSPIPQEVLKSETDWFGQSLNDPIILSTKESMDEALQHEKKLRDMTENANKRYFLIFFFHKFFF